MANLKISEMPAAGALTGAELVPIVQTGVNRSATLAGLGQFTSVADLAALKALVLRPTAVIVRTGQAAGTWEWEAGSLATADDGLVVQCTAGTSGRYKRIYFGGIDPRWFGAVCDGTTDDTTAWSNTLTAISGLGGGTLLVPPLSQVVNGPLSYAGDALAIVGDVTSSRILKTATTGNLFSFSGSKYVFEGFTVDCSGSHTAGTLFSFTGSGNVWINNVFTNKGYNVVGFAASGSPAQVFISGCIFNNFVNDGIRTGANFGGQLYISNVRMGLDATTNAGHGLFLEAGDTFHIVNVDITAAYYPVLFQPPASTALKNIFCTNVTADGVGRVTGASGWLLNGTAATATLRRIKLTNCWGGTNVLHGIEIQGADDVELNNFIAVTNQQHGLYLTGSPTPTNVRVNGGSFTGNSLNLSGTYSGIKLDDFVGQFQITEAVCGPTGGISDTQKYGIEIAGTNHDKYVISLNDLSGNTTAGMVDPGAGPTKRVFGNLNYVTENRGTGTITSGTTSATASHGLAVTPNASDILVQFTGTATNDYGNYWISGISATQFTVNVRSDPGVSGLAFSWTARTYNV